MAPKQPPSSPTQLLWAYQLKREHGFLLDRMQKLESAIDRVEKSAVAADKTNDIATLAKQVKHLSDTAGTSKAMTKMRDEVMEKIGGLHSDLESIVSKITTMEREGERMKGDSKKAHDREVDMIKKLKEVEEEMKGYRDRLGKLEEPVDDVRFKEIQGQLDGIAEAVRVKQKGMEKVEGKMMVLERVVELMREGNEKLDDKVKDLQVREQERERERFMPIPTVSAKEAEQMDEEMPASQLPTSPAERAAAASSEMTAGKASTHTKAGTKEAPAKATTMQAPTKSLPKPAARTRKTAKKNPAKKGADRPVPSEPKRKFDAGNDKPVVRFGTGGAYEDEDEDETAVSSPKDKPTKKDMSKPIPSQPKLKIDTEMNKRVIRCGKDWVEIETTPSLEDDDEDDNIVTSPSTISRKRAREQPEATSDAAQQPHTKKPKLVRSVSIQRSIEEPVRLAPKRLTILQDDDVQSRVTFGAGRGKKRMAVDALADGSINVDAPRLTRNQRNKPAAANFRKELDETKENLGKLLPAKDIRRGLTNIFSSPISDPPTEEEEDVKPPPPKKRRAIEQSSSF